MKDTRNVRNHLRCLHAIALANLGELASGLAMLSALPVTTRAIVSHLEVEYIKKAYGTVTATSIAEAPEFVTNKFINVLVHAEIKNQHGEIVAIVHVMWHLSPKERK
jgi:acyl-coenzyme A thioesterase PaaI-like protein